MPAPVRVHCASIALDLAHPGHWRLDDLQSRVAGKKSLLVLDRYVKVWAKKEVVGSCEAV